jgi:hypothetical protein
MTRKGRAARRAGELNTQAKLKLQDVQQIRAAVGSHRQIAARFGVSRSLVGLIRQGKAWATGQAN